MGSAFMMIWRLLVPLLVGLALVLADVSVAQAQAAACVQLESALNQLDRNSDFRDSERARDAYRRAQREVQRAESSYVRQGCNDDAKAGRSLSSQCRALARTILDGREQVEQLARSVETGDAVGQQREAILQEMSRFDCGNRSQVTRERRGNIFEQLFGDVFGENIDGGGGVRGDEFNPYGNYHTVRTLCVRKSDGFYWPISYSTLVEYVPNDAEQCRAQCPTQDVDLYYYDNPGQEPQQMVNQFGEPYAMLPTAFRFRTAIDMTAKCSSTQDVGAVSVQQLADGTQRSVIDFRGDTFPLPVRDPRRLASNVVTAPVEVASTFVDVPLPRRRPAAPGEAPVVMPTATAPLANSAERIVTFGDRRVRIVGPMTPYAQAGAAGT
jgi:hypothetical protein